ncbi:MAG: diaminopimelate epimerase [Polyangiaceae bacterium]
MSGISFDKYEGLGNDFLVVEAAPGETELAPALVRRLCDRRFGVGGDGVLLVSPPTEDPSHLGRMRVYNADGSVPEMCGNGLRCVALHLASLRHLPHVDGVIETDAGPRVVLVDRSRGHGEVRVDMGEIRVEEERTVIVGDEEVRLIAADAGNPHAILWPVVRGAHDRARLERLGPAIEKHAAFPRGTNVELASFEGDEVRLTVWERGVGFTLACGTGACATVGVLVARGEAPVGTPITVHLPGGALRVTMDGARAIMEGPARHVFRGHAP